MKTQIFGLDLLRILVFVFLILPFLAVFGFGMLWLWQSGFMIFWLMAMLVCGGLGYGLQQMLLQRERKLLAESVSEPNPDWPPSADSAWQQVEILAQACDPKDWPLDKEKWIFELGQRTLEAVSRCYHPHVKRPLLELTLPHTLLIIERASRDLRQDVAENIPFSNRLTIGDLFRAQRWKTKAEQIFNVYRAGRAVVNPVDALLGEAWRHLRERSFGQARSELHRWFLRTYIHKVGYYAIDLYSGRLPLDDDTPMTSRTPTSRADMDQIEKHRTLTDEPLRILVLGRSNSGKSSLINAMFGEMTAATDILTNTTQTLKPYVLSREGLTQALVFDSPGCDSEYFDNKYMQRAAADADLILWVSPANRPDRQIERGFLDSLRAFQSQHIDRRPPPLLIVVSYIDLLRPVAEWQPPYDLANQQDAKAISICAAVQTVAVDLAVPVELVIPACLKNDKVYNVEDTLWAAMLDYQDEALRVRLLRCMHAKKRAEDWVMLRRQLVNTGRFLRDLPDILSKKF
mgnify:CR=1 FL=1